MSEQNFKFQSFSYLIVFKSSKSSYLKRYKNNVFKFLTYCLFIHIIIDIVRTRLSCLVALFQKNDSSTKIANNIWNVIVKKWLNVKLLTCKEVLILEKYTGLWIQQSDWLIDCPRSVKTTFNLALKEGTRMTSFAFMIPLTDIELNRFFIFCSGGIWIFTICERFIQLLHTRINLTLRYA